MTGFVFPTTARSLSERFDAKVIGAADREIERLSPLAGAGVGSLSFCGSPQYAQYLDGADGAVILTREEWAPNHPGITYLIVENPQLAFAQVARGMSAEWATPVGISPLAQVDPTAILGKDVTVGPFAVVEKNVQVGDDTFIGAHCTIGADARIGSKTRLHPRVTLFPRVTIGSRTVIFAGTVIGSDGFGIFSGDPGKLAEMPQIGTVIIGDDVRIGANCCVDRGTIGETRIGNGVKLDNLVQVGHNATIKDNVIICAQVGIGGSVVIERNVIMGGQAGIGHGITIGENARLGGQVGASTNLEANQTYSLSPALPVRLAHQVHRYTLKLPELFRRVRALEKQSLEKRFEQ